MGPPTSAKSQVTRGGVGVAEARKRRLSGMEVIGASFSEKQKMGAPTTAAQGQKHKRLPSS